MTDRDARRSQLLGAKLGALVSTHWRTAPVDEPQRLPFGPVLASETTAAVLLDVDPVRSFGSAMAWTLRQGLDRLDLFVDEPDIAARLAARGADFTAVHTSVFWIDGADLRPTDPASLAVEVDPDRLEARSDGLDLMRNCGLAVVEEHGVVSGEVEGLEVARLAGDDPATAPVQIGVGRADREIHDLLLAAEEEEPEPLLRAVVAQVRAHRRPEAPPHPLNRLARERWLRSLLIARPELVGCAALEPLPPIDIRTDLRRSGPACAIASPGAATVIACSVGVDPDLVPTAAEIRRLHAGPTTQLVLVVPTGDDYPITREMAAALRDPASVVVIDPPWASTARA